MRAKIQLGFWRLLIGFAALCGAAAWAQQSSGGASNPLKSLVSSDKPSVASNEDEYLHPDQAFQFSANLQGAEAALKWIVAKDYYLYRDRIKVAVDGDSTTLGAPRFPEGQIKEDEYFGKQVVYHDALEVRVPVMRAANAGGDLTLKVTYQGCAEAGLCYNPITKTVVLTPAAAAAAFDGKPAAGDVISEQDRLAAALQGDSLGYALLLFFAAGVVLSLTPCVLPMIPILSGIIVGQGASVTRARSFSLAFTYVQGMALTYAAVGAIFALAFKQAPQAFFQQPWIVILMALLFVALAFAMFGAYTLQMPSFLQTKFTDASNKQRAGTFVGTFAMGALSALVVTACVAPAIVAALTVIIQSRDVMKGALALYSSGIGMGLPLLIVGASAGDLLPRAGAWMDTVKQLFGVMFIGLAIYLLQPLLPGAISMVLWAALAGLTGFWLLSLMLGAKQAPAVVRGAGLLLLVYGVALLIGALAGHKDPLQPLAGFGARSASGSQTQVAAASPGSFTTIKSVADLESAIAAAQAAGKPALLDFYADWCVSCKEMEKYTFTDPQVAALLSKAVLLRADVTANDRDDQALLNRFGVFGPPSIMFFGRDGAERKNYRVVGYMKADKFYAHAADAFSISI